MVDHSLPPGFVDITDTIRRKPSVRSNGLPKNEASVEFQRAMGRQVPNAGQAKRTDMPRTSGAADHEPPPILGSKGYDSGAFKQPSLGKPRPCSTETPLKTGRDYPLEKINWLWPGWLACGKFHLLAGQKAAGKSTILFDLMAIATIGGNWPDGSPSPIGAGMIWSGEDGIRDTILPRFVAAGGDLGRVYPVKDVVVNGIERPFDPSTDVPVLISMAKRIPELKIVVIDPVVLALPSKSDSHKNTETRRGLQPLVDFAESHGIALIGITHFTKGTSDRDPIERVTGSLAFGALPRVVWGASADEDGVQRRLVRIASNIGPTGGGIEYTLHQEPLIGYDGLSAQRVNWGKQISGSPRELLNADKKSAEASAKEFLREFLAGGRQPSTEVKAAAEAHGHSWATVRRAQAALKIKPREEGKAWFWELPKASIWTPN